MCVIPPGAEEPAVSGREGALTKKGAMKKEPPEGGEQARPLGDVMVRMRNAFRRRGRWCEMGERFAK